MKVYRSIRSLTKKVREIKRKGLKIGLVPTMGFLHEGHMSLVRRARKDTNCVVVSIFVNPIQFGPREDLKKYPRDLRHDLGLCRKYSVDIVFIPQCKDMYPDPYLTYVNVEGITDKMCGASRPGHFRGVTTVVAKLFNILMPDIAYFGQKDAQQATVIRKMTQDLNMSVRIKVMPIVREKDGLAMSSRNAYLNAEERKKAVCLYRSLRLAKDLFRRGERDSDRIIKSMRDFIKKQGKAKIDYVSIVDTKGLEDIQRISKKALVAVAVWIGKTRLIDNVVLR
jgi:pantoate--beta-alanine ligase